MRKTRRQLVVLDAWPEAEVVARPEYGRHDPTVLVRRCIPDLAGPDRERLQYLPGQPVISLFTGAGGMDIGMEAAGLVGVLQHEWNAAACETLLLNRPRYFRHAALIQGDIRMTPTSMILREAGLRVGEAAIVCGGPPCQGFTTANSNRGKCHDERNDLVFEFLRVVREAQPSFFIFENVPGFGSLNDGAYIKAFLEAAYAGFYELVYGLVDAAEYSVPQYRCRFICMGTRRDLVECDGMLGSLPKPVTFHQADLDRLSEIRRSLLFPEADIARMTRAPGIRYFPDRELLIPPRPIGADGRSKSFLEFYDRIEATEPDRIVWSPMGSEEYNA